MNLADLDIQNANPTPDEKETLDDFAAFATDYVREYLPRFRIVHLALGLGLADQLGEKGHLEPVGIKAEQATQPTRGPLSGKTPQEIFGIVCAETGKRIESVMARLSSSAYDALPLGEPFPGGRAEADETVESVMADAQMNLQKTAKAISKFRSGQALMQDMLKGNPNPTDDQLDQLANFINLASDLLVQLDSFNATCDVVDATFSRCKGTVGAEAKS
jgi:hypothetical protein